MRFKLINLTILGMFAYLDNIIVCGLFLKPDKHWKEILQVTEEIKLTLNERVIGL